MNALDFIDKDVTIFFGGSYPLDNSGEQGVKGVLKRLLHYRGKRRKAIAKIGNNSNAIIIGLTHDVDNYLDEVSCLVSPFSVSHFSRPVIEAFLHKKPTIVTDVRVWMKL